MTGYKIGVGIDQLKGSFPVIITLGIPNDALVVTTNGDRGLESNKRTDKVIVTAIEPFNNCEYDNDAPQWNHSAFSPYELNEFMSWSAHDIRRINTVYRVGNIVTADRLDTNSDEPYSHGIYFFDRMDEARWYLRLGGNQHWISDLLSALISSWKCWYHSEEKKYIRNVLEKLSEMGG